MFDIAPVKKGKPDTITDFSAKDDSIWFDDAFYKAGKGSLVRPGKVAKSVFAFDKAKVKAIASSITRRPVFLPMIRTNPATPSKLLSSNSSRTLCSPMRICS